MADCVSALKWTHSVRSDVGRVRDSNEDSVFSNPEHGVFVVADGMGGHAAGEVASAIASRTIGGEACRDQGSTEGMAEALTEAFLEAGREIARQAEEDPARSGMGTTATVLRLLRDGSFVVAHIGDSRAYLLRSGTLRRVTHDHSWVQEQVDRGLITPEQAVGHPQSNIITRALGTDPRPAPDLYVGTARPGDVFLLATDGLTDMVREEEIEAELEAAVDCDAVAARLVEAANAAGGVDNITVLLVRIDPAD